MGKGRIPHKASKLHDPEKGLLYNELIASHGYYGVQSEPHIEAAKGYYSLTKMMESERFSRLPECEKKVIQELAEEDRAELSELMLKGDPSVLRDLADFADYMKSDNVAVDQQRAKMLAYCSLKGYSSTGWRPTKKELSDYLDCDERHVKRMADEVGIEFKGSRRKGDT